MKEIPDFLDDFDDWNEFARELDYSGVTNDVDGVEYPDVSTDVPEFLKTQVIDRLLQTTGLRLKINTIFWRLTTEDTQTAPHQAHTDSSMGRFTFVLYMQDGPEGAGTALVKHKTTGGLDQDPWTNAELEVWLRDMNDYDAWAITKLFPMQANKAVLYHSKRMHRAEPVGGFGKDVTDGRLVLTAFLDSANGKV